MPTAAIDPPGVAWLRVSPKYVTVRLVEWAVGNLITVAVLSLPLAFVLLAATFFLGEGRRAPRY